MAKTVHAVDVTAYILDKVGGSIEQLKLQKLLYYCQALSLVRYGVPLFEEPIEAWVNGPVVRDIWRRHSYEYEITSEPSGDRTALDADGQRVVNSVLASYGQFAGWELVRFVHKDSPWIQARQGLEPKEIASRQIDTNAMYEFYRQKWAKNP
jgi:uncharacterized phage-associated protein